MICRIKITEIKEINNEIKQKNKKYNDLNVLLFYFIVVDFNLNKKKVKKGNIKYKQFSLN